MSESLGFLITFLLVMLICPNNKKRRPHDDFLDLPCDDSDID